MSIEEKLVFRTGIPREHYNIPSTQPFIPQAQPKSVQVPQCRLLNDQSDTPVQLHTQ